MRKAEKAKDEGSERCEGQKQEEEGEHHGLTLCKLIFSLSRMAVHPGQHRARKERESSSKNLKCHDEMECSELTYSWCVFWP